MTAKSVDVCIVGAGPAGAALALRLAQLGHTCLIVERTSQPAAGRGETLVAAALPALDALGLRASVEHAGFLRPLRTLVAWTGQPEWSPPFEAPAFQVDRQRFDRLLLEAARTAGVRVLQPAHAMRPERRGGVWRLEVDTPAGGIAIESRILADAGGRRGCLPGRKTRLAPKTLALYARWTDVPLDGPETRVEAGDHEWCWGAPLGGNRFNTAVFVDPATCREGFRTAVGLRGVHDRLLGRSTLLSPCLRGTAIGGIAVLDATPYRDEEPTTGRGFKVGEASVALDPLSSQGLHSVLGSALHAASAIHTVLARPSDTDLAVDFYRRAQASAAAFHSRATARAYAEAARLRPTPFWQRRRESSAADEPRIPGVPTPLNPASFVRCPDDVRVVQGPVLKGDFVVAGTHVLLPGMDDPVSFVSGVEIAPLLEMARTPIRARDLAARWAERGGEASLVAWTWARGALVAVT